MTQICYYSLHLTKPFSSEQTHKNLFVHSVNHYFFYFPLRRFRETELHQHITESAFSLAIPTLEDSTNKQRCGFGCHLGCPAALLVIQIPADAPGQATEDNPNIWTSAMGVTLHRVPGSWVRLAQPQMCWAVENITVKQSANTLWNTSPQFCNKIL